MTWISMWRTLSRNFSTKRRGLPKEACAMVDALKKASSSSASLWMAKMPRPPAAAFGLEHDGQAHVVDELPGRGDVHRAVGTGHHRDAQLAGDGAGLHLVAQQVHGLGRRADEGQAGFLATLRETRILGRKAPAGMDADDAMLFGFVDDAVYIKIGTRIGAQQNELLRSGGRRGVLSTSVAVMAAMASKRSRMERQIRRAGIPRFATRMVLPLRNS